MAIEFTRLNHVTLNAPAGQHEKVRWFYGKVLGLKEVPTPQALEAYYDLIWFEVGDFLIHIDFTPPFFKATDNRHLCLEVKEIAAVRRELEEKGAEIHDAIAIPGRDRFFVVDPFGNYFELLEMHSPIP